jgi:hypothetical protein
MRGVEGSARGADGPRHVTDGAVGRLSGDLLGRGVYDIEHHATGRLLQFPVDEHSLVARQHTALTLHTGQCVHSSQHSGQ